jgi:hypothetical protein
MSEPCRVFWGSHGCCLSRGHEGPHLCECAGPDEDGVRNVGRPPYYGPNTTFYGEDAESIEDGLRRRWAEFHERYRFPRNLK